jgi:hypothetical protein
MGGVTNFQILVQNLPRETEENHETPPKMLVSLLIVIQREHKVGVITTTPQKLIGGCETAVNVYLIRFCHVSREVHRGLQGTLASLRRRVLISSTVELLEILHGLLRKN